MLIRLDDKVGQPFHYGLNYGLIDVLRALCQYSAQTVIGRRWLIHTADFSSYYLHTVDADGEKAAQLDRKLGAGMVISGESLIESASFIHIVDELLIFRIIDTAVPVVVNTDHYVSGGPSSFQATNVGLEIRCCESPFEVLTLDPMLGEYLSYQFSVAGED